MRCKFYNLFSILFLFFVGSVCAATQSVANDGKPFPSLAPMIKRVHPAVVNISTYSTHRYSHNPLLNDPFFGTFLIFQINANSSIKQRDDNKAQVLA